MARLSVDLNRERIYDIASQPSFQTAGPFDVQFENHGQAVHVHLNLDESLSAVAALDTTNQYVDTDAQRSVRIETTPLDAPVTGRLKIVTGYGAESTYTTVTISPPGTATDRVEVDEQLAQPPDTEPVEPTLGERLDGIASDRLNEISDQIPLLFIGSSAIAVGLVLIIAAITDSPLVLGGSVVVVGVILGLAMTRRR